jgi:NAD-dependent SIR2 family protein deacetylase
MNIGTQRISDQQEKMLARARRTQSVGLLVDSMMQILNDDDIRSGREDLHPDWLDFFENRKDDLRTYLPREAFGRIASLFEEARPIDSSLATLKPADQRLCFLLGAGASKPDPSRIPTVKELLPQLLERARRLDREDVTKLADYCDQRKIDNIEDLLTAAQLASFCSRNATVLRLLNYLLYRQDSDEGLEEAYYDERWGPVRRQRPRRGIDTSADVSSVAFLQDTLQVLFGLLASTMLPARPNPCHEAIVNYISSRPESAIVTTNYDCCMDVALEEGQQAFDCRIAFANTSTPTSGNTDKTRLIKLHGSLNWYYCETCQEVLRVDIVPLIKQFTEDTSPYPVIGICKGCGGQRRGLLVPPLAMKFDAAPPLTPLLQEAGSAFEHSDVIVVVGFSFAEADVYISRMLSKSMQTKTKQMLVIVDPDSKIAERVRRKFKASIPNFDPTRIVRVAADCAEFLPSFLTGKLWKPDVGTANVSQHKKRTAKVSA